MRMRRKPYARPELAAWGNFINDAPENKGKWAAAFENPELPLMLELGCGKGSFIARHSLAEPQINYIGLDIKSEVLVVAKRNIEKMFENSGKMPNNVLLSAYNIEKISDILNCKDNIQRIYINFCNPWYKSGHAKHRLTHPRQLIQYRRFLTDGGEIYFKTDDDPLFEDSLRYFNMCGFEKEFITRDLHSQEPAWNIRTEHEEMFSNEGIPIKACIVKMKPAMLDEDEISRWRDV